MTTVHIVNFSLEELASIENLSVRAKNTCNEASLHNLFSVMLFYLRNSTFKALHNCGATTDRELCLLSQKYLKSTGYDEQALLDHLSDPLFDIFTRKCYLKHRTPATLLEHFRESFNNHEMPFFSFIQIVTPFFLDEREQYISSSNFGLTLNGKKKTLQAIGDIFDVTRERIRQISLLIPEKAREALSELADDERFQNRFLLHGIDITRDFLIIGPEYANEVNASENLECTPKFYSLILTGMLHRHFFPIQGLEENYNTYYFISNRYYNKFDFAGFYSSIIANIKAKHSKEEVYDNTEFLSKFVTPGNELNDRIRQICKKICQYEPGILFDKNNIVFKRNTSVKISEHIVNILEDAGKPLRLLEIHRELSNRIKKKISSPNSIRTSILILDEVVAIGKTSTYALKKWKNINSSTIKEMVKKYLEHQDEPRHIDEITKYVNQFRKTTDKNIIANLKLDKTGTFVFFARGYVGLKYRHNQPKYALPVHDHQKKKPAQGKKEDPNQLNLF